MPRITIQFSENEIPGEADCITMELSSGRCGLIDGRWPAIMPRRVLWLLNAIQELLIEYKKRADQKPYMPAPPLDRSNPVEAARGY